MPGFNILRWMDPMLSLEPHQTIVPPSPAPFPSPYGHISFLGHGVIAEKSKFTAGPSFISKGPVKTGGDYAMLMSTDCGLLEVHIGLLTNVLYPIITIFSASKSLFVSGTVKATGSNVACGVMVFMNLNLNCAFPVSLPLGVVYAFNTVQAGMSLGDVLAGVASGLAQIALEKVAGAALGGAANRTGVTGFLSSRLLLRSVTSNIHVTGPMANAIARYCGTNRIVGMLIASQVGEAAVGAALGVALDQTPAEDTINQRASDWIGSDDSDELLPQSN